MSLKYAILGLVSSKPRTGYDIKRMFGETVGLLWTATHSQIYTTLHQLQKDDLIGNEVVIQDGKPNKKVYFITEEGQKEFHKWLAKPNEIPEMKDSFLLKFIFAAGNIPNDVLMANLEAGQKVMEQRFETLSQILKRRSYSGSRSLSLAGRMGLDTFKIYIEFIKEAIALVNNNEFNSK